MSTHTTWYLIGDASRARIFVRRRADQPLQLLREFAHPESRLANHDLVTDRPGRMQQSGTPNGGNSAMEPHSSPKSVEHEHFARELASALHKGLDDEAYQNLVLVAGPEFLGLLRQILPAQVQKHVTGSLDKDYTHFNAAELEKHLAAQLDGFSVGVNPNPV